MESKSEYGWSFERKGSNVHIIRVPLERNAGWSFDVLLRSDAHHDSPDCERHLEYKHLDQAREKGAPVLDFGDLFCAMQGAKDKRAAKEKLRPEHKGNNYLDKLVDTAGEDYDKYADLFAMIAYGNHETAMIKHHETDLTQRLCVDLSRRASERLGREYRVEPGGYSGWVRFLFSPDKGGGRVGVNLWYIHGYGGGGPVTKGVIQSNRRAVYVNNADIVVSGHIHEYWQLSIPQIALTDGGRVFHKEQLHVSLPTYKDEYRSGKGGWHIERGGPPKPLGAAWLRFTWDRKAERVRAKIIRAD